jgi:hypothetical protein
MTRIITKLHETWIHSCELVNGTKGINDMEGKVAMR